MKISQAIKELAEVLVTEGDLDITLFSGCMSFPLEIVLATHRSGNEVWMRSTEADSYNLEALNRSRTAGIESAKMLATEVFRLMQEKAVANG